MGRNNADRTKGDEIFRPSSVMFTIINITFVISRNTDDELTRSGCES